MIAIFFMSIMFSGEYPAVVEKTVEEIGCPVDIENDSNDNQCIAKP